MSVKLRLKRLGRTHRAVYRLAAVDSRTPRDGRTIEELGLYDPSNQDREQQVRLNTERIAYWLSVGAQPSPTVADLIKKHKIDRTGAAAGANAAPAAASKGQNAAASRAAR